MFLSTLILLLLKQGRTKAHDKHQHIRKNYTHLISISVLHWKNINTGTDKK